MEAKVNFKMTDPAEYSIRNSTNNVVNDRVNNSNKSNKSKSLLGSTKNKKGYLANRFLDYNDAFAALDAPSIVQPKQRKVEVSPNTKQKERNSTVNTQPSELVLDDVQGKVVTMNDASPLLINKKVETKPILKQQQPQVKPQKETFLFTESKNNFNSTAKSKSSVPEQPTLNTKLAQSYQSLISQSKDLMASSQSYTIKKPVNNKSLIHSPISNRSGSVLDSVFSSTKFNEQRRSQMILDSMRKSGTMFTDINKEDFYSDSTKNQLTSTLTDLVFNGKHKLEEEIREKQQEYEALALSVSDLEKMISYGKREVEQSTLKTKEADVEVRKISLLGENLKSKEVFISSEYSSLVEYINKAKEDLDFTLAESEHLIEESNKERGFLSHLKSEAKNLEKEIISLKSETKILQRAILIKNKEINKHKLNLKTNDLKMKGVLSALVKTHTSIVVQEPEDEISGKN